MPDDAVALHNARLKESEERRRRYDEGVDAYHHSLINRKRRVYPPTLIEPSGIVPASVPTNPSPVQYFYIWLRRNAAMFTARLRSG